MKATLGRAAIALLALLLAPALSAPQSGSPADTVTRLADTFVAEYQRRFPFLVMYSGLPQMSRAGVDIITSEDLARWRAFAYGLEAKLNKIPESALIGRPEWVTRAYLLQGIAEAKTDDTCQFELWDISSYGFVFQLPTVAATQPLATAEDRREALVRWHAIAPWLDQQVSNLAAGLRGGYAAYRAAVEGELGQIDTFIAQPYAEWPTTVLARRANDPQFTLELNRIAMSEIWPASERFRDFLRNEYLPHARTTPSSVGLPQGMACLRSRLSVSTSVDMDPKAMFGVLVSRRHQERVRILELAQQAYGVPDLTWEDFGERFRADPRDKFGSAGEIRPTYEGAIARARAALPRMVLSPPPAKIVVKQGSGQDRYLPGSDDGSRPPMFLYAGPGAHRGEAESLAMHETIPGHFLQDAMRTQAHHGSLHPIARLVVISGSSEGWATYAEGWAAELGLYSGPFEEMGSLVNSSTPSAVAELGMQIADWSEDQAGTYLRDESPYDGPSAAKESVGGIIDTAGEFESYPIGAIQYEALRREAQRALGQRFDSRAYHQTLLEDGPLPFWALEKKVERWITKQR